MEGDTPKEPGELKDNVFDLATTRRRRDPVIRGILEAIETLAAPFASLRKKGKEISDLPLKPKKEE